MELTVDYQSFTDEVKNLTDEGKELNKTTPKSEEEFQEFSQKKKLWENKCINYLNNSFTGEDSTSYGNTFMQAHSSFNLVYALPLEQRVKNTKNDIIEKTSTLEYCLRLLSVSDAILNPNIVEEQNRLNWTIQQKKAILLEKLNALNDGRYYDVTYIFWSCGIGVNNDNEPRAIANSLKEYGYINTRGNSKGLSASITIDGVEALERMKEELPKSKPSPNGPDMEVLNKKMGEVIEWLKKNDMGNEIIFDELREMKEAREKLDLKNWKQLLKGKLFDLSADKALGLGIEAAKQIFKTFTGEDITKLLG